MSYSCWGPSRKVWGLLARNVGERVLVQGQVGSAGFEKVSSNSKVLQFCGFVSVCFYLSPSYLSYFSFLSLSFSSLCLSPSSPLPSYLIPLPPSPLLLLSSNECVLTHTVECEGADPFQLLALEVPF